ncbi:hypothetical protein BG006_007526 [Podila minutissima]|uniref:Uncharacterized protein n=1 Tax=Podila minutissima TaxID=64525 RepID=A0A9P5VQ27_9FUNG|nr:hypothetical protein BG006_007526 [Podila minutissima]
MTLDDPPAYSVPSHGFPSPTAEKAPNLTSEPPLLAHHICGIALTDTDKIRLINTPEPLTRLLRAAITATWGPIQGERAELDNILGATSNTSYASSSYSSSSYSSYLSPSTTVPFYSYEFKLRGNPWAGWGEEKVRCRRLVVGMLKCMIGQGYSLIQASKVIRRMGERDVFFFESSSSSSSSSSVDRATKEKGEKEEGPEEEEDVDMFSITFNKGNTVRVIDASPAVVVYVQQAIRRYWPTGIKSQQLYSGADEFLVNSAGSTEALMGYGSDAVRWSMVLVEILSALRNHLGYKLYTSVDMNFSPGPGMAIDTWILRKTDPSWS